MELETVKKLAALARLKIGASEAEELRLELSSILEYVGEIERAKAEETPAVRDIVETVTRPDELLVPPLASREELLDASLNRKGDYLEVQPIFEQ